MADSVRTLRSKRLRSALWIAADGKCQICGEPLGDDWEADHVVPWSVSHDTNVHEMQALCQRCNRKKGAGMLRQHQREFVQVCEAIVTGRRIRNVYLFVTPGGGKSLIPMIAASRLIPKVADAICWVVPRTALQEQAERDFQDPHLQALCENVHTIRKSTNEVNPCRGHQGYVTTYQAIHANPDLHRDEFARKRYILVLDEPHHIKEGGPWERPLQALVQRAYLTVFMSGTWERGNEDERIAFVPYMRVPGGSVLNFPAQSDVMDDYAYIAYGRSQALQERAIKPLRFIWSDGRLEWIDREGKTQRIQSLAETGDYAPDALFAALNTNYAYELLEKCVRDWRAYRLSKPRSKLLIVASGIGSAKDYLIRLRDKLGVTRAEIATSDDSDAARDAINRFKRAHNETGALDALVTVAMAYEGLDVPSITHVACLTHIRSTPWILQMVARAARVDSRAGAYEEQFGYIYCPDDAMLRRCFDSIMSEQEPFVRERMYEREGAGPGSRGEGENIGEVLPIDGAVTRERVNDFVTGEALSYHETSAYREALEQTGLYGVVDTLAFKRAMELASMKLAAVPEAVPPDLTPAPPSMVERRLRGRIQEYANTVDRERGWDNGTTNKKIKDVFHKPRGEQSETELRQVLVWLQETYPRKSAA